MRLGLFILYCVAATIAHATTASAQARRATPPTSQTISRAKRAAVMIDVYSATGNAIRRASGFILRDGRVVTNANVVEGASRAEVFTEKGQLLLTAHYADILDTLTDIVILPRIPDPPVGLTLAKAAAVKGDRVATIGSPSGIGMSAAVGTVNAVRETGEHHYLQISGTLADGFSGGPVLNRQGEVVAISVVTLENGRDLTLAIPVSDLRTLVAQTPNHFNFGMPPTTVSSRDSAVSPSAPKQSVAALAQAALEQGGAAYRIAQASRKRADFQRAISFLTFSDEIHPSDDAKFLIGASAFSMAETATTDAKQGKSCGLAKLARDSFSLAQANLTAGSRKYPSEASQLLTAIPQFGPAVTAAMKSFCK